MGRFTADQAENYGGQGGTGYFSLKNDKDVATVRFMYRNMDDVEGFAVHEVEIDGRKRYVNCLREYNEPLSACPFCNARLPQSAKLFIPLYNVDEDRVQIWDRGKKFFAKISSICARYAGKSDLVAQQFEIERNGKPGDTQTTYEIYPVEQPDETTLEDLPELPQILGGLVLDKSADDMEYYLAEGYFPPEEDAVPFRKSASSESRESRSSRSERSESREVTRRTPANSRRRGEGF